MRALIRADAGPSIGSGHVVRCLTLAGHLVGRGVQVTFAMRDSSGILVDRIAEDGHEILALPGDAPTSEVLDGPWPIDQQMADAEATISLAGGSFETVVVDHYGLDAAWERSMRECTVRLIALDDLANRTHDVDVLVDQNWYGPSTAARYSGLVPDSCLQLLGPRYAVLQDAYAEARWDSATSSSTNARDRIVVSFGGTDPTRETAKVVEALNCPEMSEYFVDAVVGSRSVVNERLINAIDAHQNAMLHVALPTLAGVLADAVLAVGASGAGTWERMCLSVPSVVATSSAAHSGVTEALADAGLVTWAGVGGDLAPSDYRAAVERALNSDGAPVPDLVDGLGGPRVAEAIVPANDAEIRVRAAQPIDEPMFVGMDPGAPARWSKQLDGPSAWSAGRKRFLDDIAAPERLPMVLHLGGSPIGRAVATVVGDELTIDVVLDDFVRGRGLVDAVASCFQRAVWDVKGEALAGVTFGSQSPQAGVVTVHPTGIAGTISLSTGTIPRPG